MKTEEEIQKIFRMWNRGTSCPEKKKTLLWTDGEYALFHHNSHATYTGRMSGSCTCEAYTKLLHLDTVYQDCYGRGKAIKKWDGRHNKARIEEAKKIVEELRKENGR